MQPAETTGIAGRYLCGPRPAAEDRDDSSPCYLDFAAPPAAWTRNADGAQTRPRRDGRNRERAWQCPAKENRPNARPPAPRPLRGRRERPQDRARPRDPAPRVRRRVPARGARSTRR